MNIYNIRVRVVSDIYTTTRLRLVFVYTANTAAHVVYIYYIYTVPSRGGGRRGNYPGARTQKGPGKNSVYEDISYIIIIITNLSLGPRKTLVS